MLEAGLTTAAKVLIDESNPGSLGLGVWKAGDVAGYATLNEGSVDISGNQTAIGVTTDIKWAIFGANKLNIYLHVNTNGAAKLGNLLVYLDSGAPLAFINLKQSLQRRANGDNKAQDVFIFVISLKRSGISEKFNLHPALSMNLTMPDYLNYDEFITGGFSSGMANSENAAQDRPGLTFVSGKNWFNSMFLPLTDADNILTRGVVADKYERT